MMKIPKEIQQRGILPIYYYNTSKGGLYFAGFKANKTAHNVGY